MGYQERDYYREDETPDPLGLRSLSMTAKIIIVTVIVYLANMFFGGDDNTLTKALSLDADWWVKPLHAYQLLTYGFAHDWKRINHILFNMFGFWIFGRMLEDRWGGAGLLRYYLSSIVFAGLVWSGRHFFLGIPTLGLIGASGGVTACIVLFCFFNPQARVFVMFFPMPAWAFGILIIGSDLAGVLFRPAALGTNTAFDAHLAGTVFAAAVWALGIDFGRMKLGFSGGWWRKLKSLFKSKPNLRVHSEPAYRDEDDDLEAEGDRILAKISTQGDASLTAKERRTLEQYSRMVRDKRK
jgi:membrane associated rhomboid family serine protease